MLKDKQIHELFNRFSAPMVKPCNTVNQKENAIGISKTLWLLLITKTDTEEEVYHILEKLNLNHEAIISFGALYFHKMKTNLSKKEITKLIKYYDIPENMNLLKSWANVDSIKNLH